VSPRFSAARHRRDWISYKRESRLAEGLDDAARLAQLDEMYRLYLEIQKDKSPEEREAEARAERRLNAWRWSPRYRDLLARAHGSEDDR
jgi:hypothetical protein